MKNNAYLLLTVFVSGLTVLGVELSASRLLDPFFGNSLIIWANIIGLMLIYLSVGYVIGGRWADRDPREQTFFQIIAWGAFLIGLIPILSTPILRWSVSGFYNFNAGVILGSLFGVLVLFSVPMTLLGMVSPFAIRLAVTDIKDTGRIAGSIYALSTIGSILGTFLPVLVLIPNMGTRNTFFLFSAVLLTIAVGGLWLKARRLGLVYSVQVLVVLGLWGWMAQSDTLIKPEAGVIYETESAYNYIQVLEIDDRRYLRLNEGTGVHSIYIPGVTVYDGIWDYFLIVPFFNPAPYTPDNVESMLLIGSAAGTVSKQYTNVYGPIHIDGVEIDPEISRAGERFFAMNEVNLNTFNQDGRYFLANANRSYDVIAVDAYRPPYIPFQLTSVEFFQEIHDHLTPNGVMAINAGRSSSDYSLVTTLGSTIRAVFPNVYVLDAPDYGGDLGNSLIIATKQPSTFLDFVDNVAFLSDPRLQLVSGRALNNRIFAITCSDEAAFEQLLGPLPTNLPGTCPPPFTDDKAPIEQVVHNLILGYVLGP